MKITLTVVMGLLATWGQFSAAEYTPTKIVCQGTSLATSLNFTLLLTAVGWKMQDVTSSNPIVARNLGIEANEQPIIGPQKDAVEPGSDLYQGQFDSPSPQGIGAFALTIKASGKAVLYWDDDDGGSQDFALNCTRS